MSDDDIKLVVAKKNKKLTNKSTKEKSKSIKRGPGRPRKNPIQIPKNRSGICNTPKYGEDNNMELIYGYPLVIKKLLSFYINKSPKMHCVFTKTHVKLLCQDKYANNSIRITMDGNKMHRYYCERDMEFGLALSYLEPLNKKLGKQFSEFVWFTEEDEKNKKCNIWLKWSYYSDSWNKTSYATAGQYTKIEDDPFDNWDEKDYPLRFTLKNKIFKDIIDDANHHKGTHLYIKQYGCKEPLLIDYCPDHLRFKSSNPFNNLDEIKMVSTLEEDEIFSVAIQINHLKSIASTIPSDEIEFFASKTKPLIITAYLDNRAITVRILTNIVRSEKQCKGGGVQPLI